MSNEFPNIGDEIEVGYPYWCQKDQTNKVNWQSAIVKKVWAHGEVSVHLIGSNRYNFFTREYWRNKPESKPLGEVS